jgi:hypothetical protein
MTAGQPLKETSRALGSVMGASSSSRMTDVEQGVLWFRIGC